MSEAAASVPSGSSTVMTWTATPLPSGNGSETISNRLPYILMWWEELYPRALILTQSSAVDLAILWFMTVPISCDCEIPECSYKATPGPWLYSANIPDPALDRTLYIETLIAMPTPGYLSLYM